MSENEARVLGLLVQSQGLAPHYLRALAPMTCIERSKYSCLTVMPYPCLLPEWTPTPLLDLSAVVCGGDGSSRNSVLFDSCLQQFLTTLAKLRASERGNLAPEGLPVHGVGHSNGALLHMLIGSLFTPQNASNVIISYNNKCGRALSATRECPVRL